MFSFNWIFQQKVISDILFFKKFLNSFVIFNRLLSVTISLSQRFALFATWRPATTKLAKHKKPSVTESQRS